MGLIVFKIRDLKIGKEGEFMVDSSNLDQWVWQYGKNEFEKRLVIFGGTGLMASHRYLGVRPFFI